ncbi:catenin [Loa loa]|uniref:Catenin n=1 Tax=Loa loa TaxID=7209 RepID=A0A1S0TV39_LOALO|nr:catenin [Loa loa]EFO20478.2 catenin [Loa loa]
MVSMANVQAEMNIDRVKTRTVEQLIAPLIQQVTNLMTPNGMHSLKRSGKSGAVLVAAIERTVCNFVEIGRSAIAECPIAVGNALEQLNETLQDVEHAGIEMVNTGHDFVQETSNTDRRARAIRAARNLLTVVARMLIMADMVDVRMMLLQVAKVEDIMDRLVAAESKQELSELFESLNSCMEQLDGNIKRRILELRNPAEQDDLQAARAWLKLNNMIMYTSSTAYIRHPEVDQVRLNRDFAHAQVSLALQAMADILQGSATNKEFCLSHHGRLGDLMRQFDHFQTRAYMEPSSYKDHLHRPELEGLLEKIVSGVAAIADSENTRDERKKRIVDECNNLRQALQDLLAEYEKNCGRAEPSEDLDLAMVHLGHKTKDLRRHLRRAIVDHVSDAFLDTITPLMMLIESAQRHDERATVENGKMFQEHTNKLLQAAELVCVMSNNEDGIRVIRYAAIIIDKLAPQVVNAAFLLSVRDSQVARDNMDAFKNAWIEKVKLLTMAVDAMITVDDFLAVSEAHIIEDVKSGIQAVINGDGFLLDRSAGGIRGRSLRVCSVVDSEMDLVAASSYRDRVRMATKLLRDDVINQFADRAEKVVNKLENEVAEGNSGENRDYTDDVDEFIEASELVHNAVKEIRNALLMNRNPEDVDSDNEYEEDAGTNYPDSRNQTADVENDQKIMRRLPEEEKRKIQEQIRCFQGLIAQSKFEREVAKWDETGNDIIVLAKHMCMIMMNMTDFTRGRGPLKTTMDVIKAAQEISDAGAKLNSLAKQIGDESVESETKKDLFAYLQRITLYCQQLNITSRVKADVQQVGNELVVSGLESAMSLIQTARNLLNAVVLTVKAAYIASTKYRRKNTAAPSLVEWKMAPPQKQPLVRVYNKPHGIVRRASEKRPMPPMKALAQFRTVNTNE